MDIEISNESIELLENVVSNLKEDATVIKLYLWQNSITD